MTGTANRLTISNRSKNKNSTGVYESSLRLLATFTTASSGASVPEIELFMAGNSEDNNANTISINARGGTILVYGTKIDISGYPDIFINGTKLSIDKIINLLKA
nr:MAG TPA: hypothetical protein [Caudoviricetes sp.]